jgi:hypothetical protein
MSRRLFVAYFEGESDVLGATRAARDAGLSIHDVYTPYAVHGMDEAMGLRPSRLGFFCFGAGALGLGLALLAQWWTSAVAWPLDVGGKPPSSWPAFIPVAFELTVLSAALLTVAALLVRTRLLPGRRAKPALRRVTDDRFALALVTPEHPGAEIAARSICDRFRAVETDLVEVPA